MHSGRSPAAQLWRHQCSGRVAPRAAGGARARCLGGLQLPWPMAVRLLPLLHAAGGWSQARLRLPAGVRHRPCQRSPVMNQNACMCFV